MAALPRTAAVVLNWNGREHLARLLPTLALQDHPDHLVVVVDNGSRDGSARWLEQEWPGVERVELDTNRRFAAGNNAGAQRAIERGAELVLLLNNDTEVDPGLLRRLAQEFAADPAVGLAGVRICELSDRRRIWYGGGRWSRTLGLAWHRAIGRDEASGADPAGPTDWVTGCALAVRAPLWERLGGLDEGYYIYAEDLDLCLRARDLGAAIRYIPETLVWHAVSASTGGHQSPFKVYQKLRARGRLLRRHAPAWAWPLRAPVLLLHDLAWALRLLTGGHGRAALAVWQARADEPATNRYPVGEAPA